MEYAFLGLGVMGSAMAANLARSGAKVKGWNRTGDRPTIEQAAAAGVQLQPTIAAAVAEAAIVFSCVGDGQDVAAVLLGPGGAAEFAQMGTVFVDTSTIGPRAAREVAIELAGRGMRFVDAPVSGGDVGARAGTLTVMGGGAAADWALCGPALATMGKTLRHCGPVGAGQAVKLCNQVLAAASTVAVCEAIALAHNQGLDPQLMIEVCNSGAAASWSLANLGPKILAGNLEPGFAIAHMLKDLRLVQENWTAAGPLPSTQMAAATFAQVAAEDGGDRLGTQAAIELYPRRHA